MYLCKNKLIMNGTDLNTPVPPSLSPELLSIYLGFNEENKRIFLKMFNYLWSVVAPARKFISFGGVLYAYWAVDLLRERAGLCSSELSLLSYIYQVSNKGRNFIHSNLIYNSAVLQNIVDSSKQRKINDLKRRGYLIRSTWDANAPYLSRSRSRQPVFIKLTYEGVRLIEGIEKDLYKILVDSSFNDLTTGINK
jgi:hypothetical protein